VHLETSENRQADGAAMVLLTTTGQWCITEATTSRRSTGVLRRSSTYSKHSLVLGFVGWVGARQRFERGAATWLANNAAFTAKVTALALGASKRRWAPSARGTPKGVSLQQRV